MHSHDPAWDFAVPASTARAYTHAAVMCSSLMMYHGVDKARTYHQAHPYSVMGLSNQASFACGLEGSFSWLAFILQSL